MMKSSFERERAQIQSLDAEVSRDLQVSLLSALEVGVQKAAERFAKAADLVCEAKHQAITEHEAYHLMNADAWSCSCHVGFYSNHQVIANLLHLIVQLSLFPRCGTRDSELQVGSRSARIAEHGVSTQDGMAGVADVCVQTSWTQRNAGRPRECLHDGGSHAVRIGGGYHIVYDQDGDTSGRSASPNRGDVDQHAYAHGAPSHHTPLSRYSVGTYFTGSMYDEPSHTGQNRPHGLYRVLKPCSSSRPQSAERQAQLTEDSYQQLVKNLDIASPATPRRKASPRCRPCQSTSARSHRREMPSRGPDFSSAARPNPNNGTSAEPPSLLRDVFTAHCGIHKDMDGKTFAKLCKDAHFLDKDLTTSDVDILFAKVLPKGQRRIDFSHFESLLALLAEKKGVPVAKVRFLAAAADAPVLHGTVADTVRLHDDKKTYTGTQKATEAHSEHRGEQGPYLLRSPTGKDAVTHKSRPEPESQAEAPVESASESLVEPENRSLSFKIAATLKSPRYAYAEARLETVVQSEAEEHGQITSFDAVRSLVTGMT
eukprot:TRINITY_DN76577_c0_g1_i1.p1 TRINITY_DN76577_c0_g1~~TRINITY_DN76577_c0_g1_i1.p1  ORF type:complete len:541 (-),score=87.43 TRINITY_DN76577_c0_g1_i1:320-1942(-)